MFDLKTSTDTPNATSSPAWAGGQLLLDLLDGQMTGKSGQHRAPANRSRSPAKAPELLMNGTYGPTFSVSSVPVGPLSLWESRLRQRLAKIGSSECDLTWKASPMSDGVLLSRLVPSTPRTVEIDSGLLLEAALWATCAARDWKSESASPEFYAKWLANPKGKTLPMQIALMAAMYPTPSASGFEASDAQRLMERRARCKETTSAGNGFGLTLGQFACLEAAMWPTATAVDGHRGLTTRPQDTGIPLPQKVGQVLGMAPAGSSGTTGKRGVLNPAFPCWLMGYPLAHLSCGGTAMRSSPSSRRKSSAPGSTVKVI